MSASDSPEIGPEAAGAPRLTRPRPQLISTLRVVLLAVAIGLTVLVVAWTIVNALRGPSQEITPPPLTVASPKLIGQDEKDRTFVVTANSAQRENATSQRIDLDHPVLTRDEGGRDFLHAVAQKGVYDEKAGRLELGGGVQVSGTRGEFTTPATVYDTKAGELVGGGVRGRADFGKLQAGSFTVRDKGKSVVYQGGVRARLNTK
jgi:lipopolysaccharide export system protein LptC